MIMGLSRQWIAAIVAGVVVLVMMSAVAVWAAPKVWRRLVPPDPVSLSVRAGSPAALGGTNGAAAANAPAAPNGAVPGGVGSTSSVDGRTADAGAAPPYAVSTIAIRMAQN